MTEEKDKYAPSDNEISDLLKLAEDESQEIQIKNYIEIEKLDTENNNTQSLFKPTTNLQKERDDDYIYSRKKLKETIDTATEALDSLNTLAQQTNHPLAFEVVSKLVKVIADANMKLLELHEIRQDIDTKQNPLNVELSPSTKPTKDKKIISQTQNNIFVGSTTELQTFMKELQNKPVDEE